MIQSIKILTQYIKTKYAVNFKNRSELEDWQEKKVRRFLRRILADSDFYRQYYEGLDIARWPDWPMINKKIMMENFTSINTVGITLEEAFATALAAEESRDFTPAIRGVTVGLSSGTSGNRGLFLAGKNEQAKWAGAVLAKMLPEPFWKAHRIAFFLRANSNLYKTVGKHRIKFEFFDLLAPIDESIARLNAFQPTILVGPPSILRILADALHRHLHIAPEKVISVAEVLDPLDKKYLEGRFQQIIHQIYQCTEGFLGVTCRFGTLHLNEDLVVIQKDYLDDERKRFCPVITDFNRTSQPIIRYRLDDILTEKTTCPCGTPFTAIENIEGRCDDVFYIPAKTRRQLIPVFPDFIRRAIITSDESIIEYVAMQRDETHIDIGIRYNCDNNAQTCIRDNLEKLWESAGTVSPEIRFVDIPERPLGQKIRRVERQFDIPWEK